MINTVTQQFKEIASKDGRTFRGKAVINNVEYKEFREFKMTMSCESNNSLSFGSTYSSKIEITLADVQNSTNIDTFTGQKMDLYIGLKMDSGFDTFDDENVYEWVKMGVYNIQSPKLNDSDLSFTAFDNFYKCDQGFFTNLSGMQYVRDIVSEQCLKIGIEYVNDIEEVQYNIDVLKGLTIREAFGYLASYLGKNAIFNEEGKLKFIWYDVIDKTIDSDRFSSPLDIGNEYIIRGLKCNTRNETTSDGITNYEYSTLTVGESEYLTFDNLFMTEERLLVLLERINGMTIMSCSLNWTMAEPHIQPGDIVEIKDTNGSVYNVPVMDIEINIDGGCYGTLKSKYESNNDVSNTFGGSLSEKVNRIYQETASFKDVMADRMKAITGEFQTVNTDILNVYKELNAQKIITDEIDTKYAKIDFSNVGTQYVDEIFGKSSFFEKTTIQEATIYELKNVTFDGDLIKSNTIIADKLLIKGEDGLYYRLNAEGGHLTKEQLTDEKYKNYLDGTNIVAKSITTDQLNVNKLSAITSNLGDINGGSININDRFIVDGGGNLTSKSGYIAGWQINQTNLTSPTKTSGTMQSVSQINPYGFYNERYDSGFDVANLYTIEMNDGEISFWEKTRKSDGDYVLNQLQIMGRNINNFIYDGTTTIGNEESLVTMQSIIFNDDGGIDISAPDGEITMNGMRFGVNKVLATPNMYMKADQTVNLSEPVSSQPHGIVLAWSAYVSGEGTKNNDWNFFFIPKHHVQLNNGGGIDCFNAMRGMRKYVYVYDDKIKGHTNNNTSGTQNGIEYANKNYVLRYVIGV